uniref:glycosyltransferase family 2 protein n=1 Tax=Shimia biformata TaxID=1294299 RepID=UPI0019504CFC
MFQSGLFVPDFVEFWKSINAAQKAAIAGNLAAAEAGLNRANALGKTGDADFDSQRRNVVSLLARTYKLTLTGTGDADSDPGDSHDLQATGRPAMAEPGPTAPTGASTGAPVALGPITADGTNSVSLVTCAMNRTENLLKALPTWLACPEIAEIVIVDWSSDVPVRAALDAAGVDDARVRVIRVDGEPRWILSYAFNIGFRVARGGRILKADADITLSSDFFARNRLDPGCFIAGNWRRAQEDQAHVNGFFYLHKADLAAVGGFNEFITTYGWDDDDIYERLTAHGADRRDVDPRTIFHLPHSDAERIGAGSDEEVSARGEITGGTMYRIRRNRFLANVMPYWDRNKIPLPLEGDADTGGDMRLVRSGWLPNPVPPQIDADADYYALLEMTAWRLGWRVLGLDRAGLQTLTSQPFDRLSPLTVEVLLAGRPGMSPAPGGYLVVDLETEIPSGDNASARALERLDGLAAEQGKDLVLRADLMALPPEASALACSLPFVPTWENIGTPASITTEALMRGDLPATSGPDLRIILDGAAVAALTGAGTGAGADRAAPAVTSGRARLFIDAQHGLGNRLR